MFTYKWILAVKCMIIKLKLVDQERLCRRRFGVGSTWISQTKGNRLDFIGRLRAGGDMIRRIR